MEEVEEAINDGEEPEEELEGSEGEALLVEGEEEVD